MGKKVFAALKWAFLVLIALLLVVTLSHLVGGAANRKTPEGGINESLYVDINGAKQWISIYGEDLDNPVLLYLHGGPGSSTSHLDYAFTRKWADVYTVVTWDQRNCGKSYDEGQNDIVLTRALMMEDGREMTEFLMSRLSKDKITLLGHSWGSLYGANLALTYPEYYDCFIGVGQVVDMVDNEVALKKAALEWAKDDPEGLAMVERLTPDHMTLEHALLRNEVMERYGYGMMRDGSDYNAVAAVLFNPYYDLSDYLGLVSDHMGVYVDFFDSDELRSFSLWGNTNYDISYYNVNGDEDYQANYELAKTYFDQVDAPVKEMFVMEHATHGLLESKSEEFSIILHEIATKQRAMSRGDHDAFGSIGGANVSE